jgi:hypothetical protein
LLGGPGLLAFSSYFLSGPTALTRFSHESRSEAQEAVQDAMRAPQAMPRIVEEET